MNSSCIIIAVAIAFCLPISNCADFDSTDVWLSSIAHVYFPIWASETEVIPRVDVSNPIYSGSVIFCPSFFHW